MQRAGGGGQAQQAKPTPRPPSQPPSQPPRLTMLAAGPQPQGQQLSQRPLQALSCCCTRCPGGRLCCRQRRRVLPGALQMQQRCLDERAAGDAVHKGVHSAQQRKVWKPAQQGCGSWSGCGQPRRNSSPRAAQARRLRRCLGPPLPCCCRVAWHGWRARRVARRVPRAVSGRGAAMQHSSAASCLAPWRICIPPGVSMPISWVPTVERLRVPSTTALSAAQAHPPAVLCSIASRQPWCPAAARMPAGPRQHEQRCAGPQAAADGAGAEAAASGPARASGLRTGDRAAALNPVGCLRPSCGPSPCRAGSAGDRAG